jgi:hypothetical protein
LSSLRSQAREHPRQAPETAAVAEAIPEDVGGLAEGADALDAFALDALLRAVVRAMQRIDWQMGRFLRIFLDRRLFRLMLFPTVAGYLREQLGVSARKARALVALERKMWPAPDSPRRTATASSPGSARRRSSRS